MSKIIHLCVSIRGVLNWNDKELTRLYKGCITNDDGKILVTAHEIRNALYDELAKGHDVLPTSDDCVGFDYKKGCPGHETKEEQ